MTVRPQNVLVLRSLLDRCHYLPFNRDQVEDPAARRQFRPVHRSRLNRRLHIAIPYLRVVERQLAGARIGKSDSVGDIANPQIVPRLRVDPQAFRSVLKHSRRAVLIVGNRSVNPHPPAQIALMQRADDPPHGYCGNRPRAGGSPPKHFYVAQRRDVNLNPHLVVFAVKTSRRNPRDLDLRVQQRVHRPLVAGVDHRLYISAINQYLHPRAQLVRAAPSAHIRSRHQVGRASHAANAHHHAVALSRDHLIECRRHRSRRRPMPQQHNVGARQRWPKPGARRSPYLHAVAGRQGQIGRRFDINRRAAVLHK